MLEKLEYPTGGSWLSKSKYTYTVEYYTHNSNYGTEEYLLTWKTIY